MRQQDLHDLEEALEEQRRLQQINGERQAQIVEYLKTRQLSKEQVDEEERIQRKGAWNGEQLKGQYIKVFDQLSDLWQKLDSKREEAEDKIDRLTHKLDTMDARATELSESFKSYKRDIARDSRNSRTGKPIKLKRILAFEAAEEAKDRQVAEVRLKYINTLNQIKKLEGEVKQKEELAEGLHLIDFEQLKIENQTLNEKIEERNDELHKFRKKTNTTVQVLTHIKEKLHFVRQENAVLQRKRDLVDNDVLALRDKLSKVKKHRDNLRADNAKLKQKQGFVGSDLLVQDFESQRGLMNDKQMRLDYLMQRHAQLTQEAEKARLRSQQVTPQGTILMRGRGGRSSIAATLKQR